MGPTNEDASFEHLPWQTGVDSRAWQERETVSGCLHHPPNPNYEEEFETLTWRKCQAEFEGNLKAYKKDKQYVLLKPYMSKARQKYSQVLVSL